MFTATVMTVAAAYLLLVTINVVVGYFNDTQR